MKAYPSDDGNAAFISLARGEDLAYVSRQLGHANPAITLAIYTHFIPRKRRSASNALDRSVDTRKKAGRDPVTTTAQVKASVQF